MHNFDDGSVQLDMPCSDGISNRCWLIMYLERWNNLINPYGTELVQVTEDKVCIRTLPLDVTETVNVDDFTTAVCLLLWLVRQHRCIAFITLLVDVVSSNFAYPLYDALTFRQGYKCVKIQTSTEFLDARTSEAFLSKLRQQNHLIFLELCGVRISGGPGMHLWNILLDNPSLMEFSLTSVIENIESVKRLFRALSEHGSLTTLTLRLSLQVDPTECECLMFLPLRCPTLREFFLKVNCRLMHLYEALAMNISLSKLVVTTPTTTTNCLLSLALSMNVNTTLKSLQLIMDKGSSPLSFEHCKHLADIIQKNAGLEELDLRGCPLPGTFARRMSTALPQNRTLKRLEVAGKEITPGGLNSIIEALQRNKTIEQINLGVIDDIPADIFRRISRYGELGRLRIHYTDDVIPLLIGRVEQGLALSEADVTSNSSEMQVIGRLCKAFLNTSTTLTRLFLTFPGTMDMPAAKSLSVLFALSPSLRSVVLSCKTYREGSKLLINGLAKSQTISNFELDGWCLDRRVVEAVVEMLVQNKSINTLTFRQSARHEVEVLNSCIHLGVNLNQTLLTLNIFVGQPGKRIINYSSLHTLRRNECLVNLVSDCIIHNEVRGQRALDLQHIHSSDALLLRLQEKASCSRDEALQKVQRALREFTA